MMPSRPPTSAAKPKCSAGRSCLPKREFQLARRFLPFALPPCHESSHHVFTSFNILVSPALATSQLTLCPTHSLTRRRQKAEALASSSADSPAAIEAPAAPPPAVPAAKAAKDLKDMQKGLKDAKKVRSFCSSLELRGRPRIRYWMKPPFSGSEANHRRNRCISLSYCP
jgi:hypothetical protein